MEHFEQLLTCCVCLDRYRNPKLLPCQHSFCMEPCMEGLVDYVRRQVKCPECRAEHRIPYQGVQAFPTNVTLQRFLELRMEITGEPPDPTSGLIMERCNVCSEKAYLSHCAHCDKKICEDCKSAHMDILRREITRINSQIRRGINRLQDALSLVEKNTVSLQTNCFSVSEEVDEVYHRMSKALKDRAEHLRTQIDQYRSTELRNLNALKENLDLEVGNIQSNCDMADKYMNENVDWDDCELMDTKEIFLKTIEFMRSFESENADFSRRVRFFMEKNPNELVTIAATFGDLHVQPHTGSAVTANSGNSLQAPAGPGLMRSKSDHRLASQFRQQQEERGIRDEDEPVLGGRKFGERNARASDRYSGGDRYGRSGGAGEYDYGNDYDNDSSRPKSRFRSRFVRSHQNDDTSDNEQGRGVRFNEKDKEKERDRVIDTEDVARGHLSGIIRLTDSPRVMKRLQETDKGKKEKKVVAAPPAAVAAPKRATATPAVASRQMSEDEIDRIKRQNKGAASSTATADPDRPAADRVAALKSRASAAPVSVTSDESSDHSAPSSPVRRTPPAVEPKSSPATSGGPHVKTTRSASSDSSTSESSASSSTSGAPRNTGAPFTTKEVKQKLVEKTPAAAATAAPAVRSRAASAAASAAASSNGTTSTTPEKKPFQSRFLPSHQAAAAAAAAAAAEKKEETESSSEEETSSEESEEEEEEVKPAATTRTNGSTAVKPDTAPLQTRTSNARDTLADTRRNSRTDDSPTTASTQRGSGYNSPTYGRSFEREPSPKYTRTRPTRDQYEEPSRYGSSGYQSRFLNKSKSSALVASPHSAATANDDDNTGEDSDSKYGTGRSRYLALKERRSRLARSRSSHNFGLGDDNDDLDEPVSPTTASPNAYLASRYGTSSSLASGGSDLARSRSSHALKSRESSPIRSSDRHSSAASSAAAGDTDKDGQALSSWARYLKNKYGNRSAKDAREPSSTTTTPTHSSSSASASSTAAANARRLSLGLPLRQANEIASSDDDSKNGLGSPTSPTAAAAITGVAGTSPRAQYLQKRRQLFQLGGRGSEPGCFTWPRGISVGPDNSIVVADSSNHRVQVFDSNGIFVKEFGQYGSGEGEFDCLAGVAVNRIGQYIIADRYNHRIQVLDPSGRFLRTFGSQGTADGKFNYPWGVTTDALGFIYVCDKENHRVQVFQSDGSFVGKFGSCGKGEGQLEHPHYIAVSNTNRVIVSDSNNHRIQIFDVNGRVLSTFGVEGSDEGQFKFPRGVAVDDQGFICVADSGNNRIQIFHPDGSFLRAFGSWGSGDAEFKGLEGVAIMSNGNILVCDRENHRVQVF